MLEIHIPYQAALAFPQSSSSSSPFLQSSSRSEDNSESSGSTGNSRFLTYESSVLGIRIQYPSSWSFSEDKGEIIS